MHKLANWRAKLDEQHFLFISVHPTQLSHCAAEVTVQYKQTVMLTTKCSTFARRLINAITCVYIKFMANLTQAICMSYHIIKSNCLCWQCLPSQFHRVETPPDSVAEYDLPRDRSHSTTLSSSPASPPSTKMPIEQSTRGSNMDFRGRDEVHEVDGSAVSKAKEVSWSDQMDKKRNRCDLVVMRHKLPKFSENG